MNENDRRDGAGRDLWRRFVRPPAGGPAASPCPGDADWAAYLAGALSKTRRSGLEAHLLSCSACLDALAELRGLLREDPVTAPADVVARARGLIGAPRGGDAPVPVFRKLREAALPRRWVLAAAAALVLVSAAGGWRLGRTARADQRRLGACLASEISFGVSEYLDFGGFSSGSGAAPPEKEHDTEN